MRINQSVLKNVQKKETNKNYYYYRKWNTDSWQCQTVIKANFLTETVLDSHTRKTTVARDCQTVTKADC